MTRNITSTIQKKLFALSKGYCQNPSCDEKVIVTGTKAIFNIGELAHIIGHSSKGPRGNELNEEDNSFDNLIVLCPNCHTKIDNNPDDYSVELLKGWKENTISKFKGIKTFQDGWNEISSSTQKKIKSSLVLNGREQNIDSLLKILKGSGKKIEIKSDSLLESYLFVFAVLVENQDQNIKGQIINNQEEFESLAESNEKIIIIPKKGFIPSNIGTIIEKGHNILLFSGKLPLHSTVHFDNTIELFSMNRFDRINGLIDILDSKGIAEKVYRETKGYLFPILRNKALQFNESLTPEWLDKIDKKVLTTIFLLTEWEENTDKELVKYLSDKKYDEFVEILENLEKEEDSPIRKISNVWQIISKNDLWIFVKNDINQSVLNRLKVVSEYALSDLDPREDLPLEDRWMANILTDKRPEFSSRSKIGLSDSLTLLSIIDDDNIQTTINNIVSEILYSEKNISKLLNSIRGNIENIAEASPKIFLKFINDNINKLEGIFKQTGGIMGGSGSYINLLWALERLSWNEDYVDDVINILFKLANRYDGNIADNYSNRPLGTLEEIFVPWLNNTILDVEHRTLILKKESIEHESTVFNLLINIFNKTTSSGIVKPNYQNWAKDIKPITRGEHNIYLNNIIELIIELFKKNVEVRILDVIQNFTKFSKESFDNIIDFLMKYDYSKFKNQDILLKVQSELERKLHHFKIYKHESILIHYPEVEEKLIKLHSFITPKDIIISNISLFDDNGKIVISKLDDYKGDKGHRREDEIITSKERNVKIVEIYDKYGFDGILKLVEKLKNYNFLVKSIIDSGLYKKIEDYLFNLLDNKNEKLVYFSMNFISQLDFVRDKFINALIKDFKNFKNDIFKSNFLLGLQLNTRTLKIVKKQNESIQDFFWRGLGKLNYSIFLREDDYGELDYFIRELNKYELSYIAFNEIGMVNHNKDLDKLDNKLIIETLEKLVYFINNKKGHIHSLKYNLENILEYLYEELDKGNISKKDLFKVEIIYIKAIDNPKILNEDLCNNPESYVKIICDIFKSKSKIKEKITEEKRQFAENSYEILRKFKLIPGYKEGKIDYKKLKEWITHVLKGLKKTDRYTIGCGKVGEILINCPAGKDGVWPVEEVRDIFEEFSNDSLENGFKIGKINARGVISKGIYDGGEQERSLAEGFYNNARKIKKEFPRTSKILKQLGDSYTWDAKREDERVELDR